MCGTVVISQQQALGITIQSNGSVVSTLNVVQGDYIGTDVTGLRALGNSIGVNLFGSASNTIGGTNPGSGNVISGNTGVGVSIDEGTNEVVQGNLIGTDKSGIAALPNGYAGVLLGGNAGPTTGDTIGGTIAGSGNVIAFNTAGVVVAQATGGAILGNSIFGNASNPNSGSTGLGIDLGNDRATPNTPGGPHVGPNNLQNFPVITAVTVAGGNTTVSGTLNSAPTTAFRLEFFANPAADPSGFGQGKIFLGALPSVTTDAQGNASFGFNAPDDLTAQFLAANATDPAGTSPRPTRRCLCRRRPPSRPAPTRRPSARPSRSPRRSSARARAPRRPGPSSSRSMARHGRPSRSLRPEAISSRRSTSRASPWEPIPSPRPVAATAPSPSARPRRSSRR